MTRVLHHIAGLLMLAMIATTAVSQTQTPVSYSEDFQSYGKSKKPLGWIDGKVGDLNAKPRGYFNTAIDPLGDKKSTNIVYGTTKSTGSDDEESKGKRIGYFATYVTKTFAAAGRFEFQGRMVELSSQGRFGFVVLSGYPDKDKYYLIGEEPNTKQDGHDAQDRVHLRLTAFGAGTPTGTIEIGTQIERSKWYRFRISVDDANNSTVIRARFWKDGTTEPSTYQIDATDSSPARLKTGHIGIWSGGRGDSDNQSGGGSGGGGNLTVHVEEDGGSDEDGTRGFYIDDIAAHSPSDTTAPLINFYETGSKLDPTTTPAFNHDAKIEIRVTDDLSTFTYTAQLDGVAYTSLTPVSIEGPHTLIVHAVDAPGNARDATLKFIVDKKAPVIALLANGNPLVSGTIFDKDVTLSATIQDMSTVTTTSTLDGGTVTLPLPVAQELNHQIIVTAMDVASNSSTASAAFTIDKTAPVIAIQANGKDLATGSSFRENVTLTWTAADLTLDTVTAKLDNATIQSGFTVTTEAQHTLVIIATDKANHSKTETRSFFLAKHAPEVTLLANGSAFVKDRTYNTAVQFTVVVQDPTPTTTAITVDNNAYTQGTPVTGDGLHTVQVVVTNSATFTTTVGPFNFFIDTAPPAITMTESGQPFPDGFKFTRDVLPVVTATDALTTNPTIVVILDGKPYPTNTPVTEEKADHVISATATDNGGNSASVGPFHFMLDKSKPVVTIVNTATGKPFPSDALFNVAVSVKVTVVDVTKTTVVATLDGAAFDLGARSLQADGSVVYTPASIASEAKHALSVVATDEVGFSNDPATAGFVIDMTPPNITFTDPEQNATLTALAIIVAGTADDAQTITINGRAAEVNSASKTFTISDVALLEGRNEIAVVATDAAGNVSRPTLVVFLDTRAPELSITAPAADSCVDTTSLQVSGKVSDPHLDTVNVTVGSSAPVAASIDSAAGTWTAAVAVADETKKLITVEATDKSGHSTSVSRNVVIDRTPPSIEVRENGSPFTASFVNRTVALFIRAGDADPKVAMVSMLDGAAYASGTSISTEGHHALAVTATDCAAHTTNKSIEFTIDLTAPSIRNLNPANGGKSGTMPSSISGTTDTDATRVEIAGTPLRSEPAADGTFTIPAVPFVEGQNHFVLSATDRAGNATSLDYNVTVKTIAPVVEIRESGLPITNGTLFNRAVTPVIRSVDLQATIGATLNGSPYTSGTTISNDGDYTLHATATDTVGHTGTADTTFTIDRTPPIVKITSPAAGTVQTDHVQVRGTAGDAITAAVNGQPVALAADGSFVVDSLLLDIGINTVVATGRDRAGNTGRDEIAVTRDDIGAGILLTYPPDHSRTNRPATDVIGRLLTPGRNTLVAIGSTNVPVDSTGAFRVSGYTLVEGENTITATTTAPNGVQMSASTHVTADFTPPALTILESGQPLGDGVRFAAQAVISLQAADAGGGAVTTELTIDGSKITTAPFTITAAGGHSVLAVARDLAGNEARAERTLFIGTSSAANQCQLDSFDPADGTVILSNKTELVGRSGGAIGVKVNGVPAIVADGAFCASVELPQEGPNTITIVCTDANGSPTGTPATITLRRVTGDPSIGIDTPAENFVSAQESIAVTGTTGAGVVSADVNGVAATITGSDSTVPRPFTVAAVRLATGLNIVVAHGRNAAGRVATASRRGLYLKDAPSINISSPSPNTTTGIPALYLSGTYANLDPTTLVVSNLAYPNQSPSPAQFVKASDTGGSFTATGVPLTSGDQTILVSGRDRLARTATANVVVRLTVGTPSILITQPADHASFGGGSDSVTVGGTFQAAVGSIVDVNGVAATVTGTNYSASVKFSTLAGGITPLVARVTEPGGASASATVIVTQVADAPTVIELFPAQNAAEVDNGVLLLVLFSEPMDGATLSSGAFRLEDGNGTPVSGASYLDKDVFTFAPATLLTTGGHYTLRVTTGAKNLAGTALSAESTSSFTVSTSAPSTAPALTPLGSAVCGQSIAVNGTAAPGARVRLESGALVLNGAADTTGKFTFTFPLSGQSGFALVRVRVVGSDGSVSPEAELKVRIDCNGPQVLNSALDRTVNKLTIQFSEPIDSTSATVGAGNAILMTLDDGRAIGGSATVAQSIATITPAEDLSAKSVTLTVTTAIKDLIGNRLVAPYTQTFAIGGDQPKAGDGTGFISGEVYDATTGRPLAGAAITIDVAATAPVTASTDARGRYLARLREGAHTIKAAMTGYTSVWRQIVVPAGAGVVPIDIRLTRRGDVKTSAGSAIASTHGGDTTVTKKIDLTIPAGALAAGRTASVTSVGAQALTGLLPLGWSPIGSAEITVDGSDASTPLSGAQLTFNVSPAEITSAAQNLTAVQYDAVRDEWRVLVAVVNVGSDGKAIVPIAGSGAYALVYPDKATGLTAPPLPVAGDVLRGVPPDAADAPALAKRDFLLNPPVILPSGRTVATLRIEGSGKTFPSGTAVQAYIDEDLKLADGSRLLDPPFATDLLLYRTLAGDLGVADFHLAPSAKASEVVLEVGVDHIRILPYPGRLDRGTLIGSEGGRVPADDKVAVEIPTGSVPEPLRATATALTTSDLNAIGTVAGFRIAGGFQLTLQRATQPPPQDLNGDGVPDAIPPVELFVPANVTFTVDASQLPARTSQVILGELLDQTPYGRMIRLAVPMMPVDTAQTSTPAIRFTTKSIDRSVLAVDGVVHEGRYVLLAAESPIAFATGTIHQLTATGRLLADARVLAPPLGVADLSRQTGIYNIPVPAKPAAPFTLIPRHTSTGDGSAYVHSVAPDADGVVRVDLVLAPQPPILGSVVVLKGDPPSQATLTIGVTTDVALATNVRASFTPSIDPASVNADSITVTDTLTGQKVSGGATADGSVAVVWTLTAGERLKPNSRYIVAIASSIRGMNGASLAHGASFTIATVAQLLNSEVHRERIRITIPDANGMSRISGDAGALPAGWQAVAVRRGKDFIVRYQGTAASDGSFSFQLGNGGDAADRITLGDLIDLRVVNNVGNVAAIFALTPFVTEDGRGFVVPAGAAVRFTTPEGFTLDVPAGAFDVPTVININAAKKEEFLEIPSLEAENEYIGSVHIDFAGKAKMPLMFEAPVPAGFDTTGKQFILAEKLTSLRGPRLAVVDVLRVDNGKFTTTRDPNAPNQLVYVMSGLKPGVNQTLTGSKFSKYMRMLGASGIFMYLDIKQPVGGSVGWGVMEGLQAGYDLTWDIFASYFIPFQAVVERGGAIIPIVTGKRFTVVGTDPGTGLQAFSRTYDPIPFGPPGTVVPIASAQQNDGGPYPVFGGPFRVEMLDLDIDQVDIRSVRNFVVRLDGGTVLVTPGNPALDADRGVELLDITNGTFTSGKATSPLSLSAKQGDRIVLLIEERDVDPASAISIAFNEPVYAGGSNIPDDVDAFFHDLLKVEQAAEPVAGAPPLFTDITVQVRFTTDSGGRRINVVLASALQREAVYRITLKPGLADVVSDSPGLKLGQGTVDSGGVLTPVGGGNELHLLFHVRKPAGALGTFTAGDSGLISGMDLAGNMLFVAAQNGGLLAYDVSNPAALGANASPTALVPGYGMPGGIANTLAVTVDRHNRVYTTAQMPIAGIFRSYRVEDFVAGGTPAIKGSTIISWKLGYSQMIGLPSNTVVSDKPESIPFRIKVLLQDDEKNFANRQEFVAGTGAAKLADYPDDLQKFTLTIGRDGTPYTTQRITVENLTLDMRWSGDATSSSSAVLTNIIARSTDKLRLIRNQHTYAVVAHLGYGIGLYDANAIESNRFAGLPPNHPDHIREQLLLTAGKIARECPNATPDFGIIENYLNTDAELRGDPNGDIYAYAVDPYRGVLDLRLTIPGHDDDCGQRSTPNYGGLLFRSTPPGNEAERIQALRSAFMSSAGREPYNHFTQVAQFHWSVTAAENTKGVRGTPKDSDAQRDYLLVAGFEYGLVVVDINGDPPVTTPFPLVNENVADVIWIPGGAAGVRVYQSANIAVVNDRFGRVYLVDLSRIDERWDEKGAPTSGLFPTAKKALAGVATDPYGVGSDDPRIIWKSDTGVTSGTLAPVFDVNTGIVFAGAMAQRQIKILSALDPRLQVKVNLGDESGLSDVGGIVPLGIAPPQNIQDKIDALPACSGVVMRCRENASLGAFRLELALPGNMVDSLTQSSNELQLAVESERVAGAITEQTPAGFPRAHLRRTRRDGSAELTDRAAANFKFKRIVPDDLKTALRNQSGYNRFVSPWIIAIADPRASSKYDWNGATAQQKKDAGCEACDRPTNLKDLTENDGVYELWTNGRFIAVRPELKTSNQTIFDSTQYQYLGQLNRLFGRFSTIMADTVRPTEALVAAQNPPVATGAFQQTIFLHSGEVESNDVDLDAGGRADFDVMFDRTYRSRTIGGTVLGQGWDSPMFRRLRALPSGDVEFRDGSELWLFRGNQSSGGYDSPKGLFLKLSRTQRGWKMIDQQWRIAEFDDLGRLLSQSDEFFDPQTPSSGNVIRFVYDEGGRLSQIIDPVQRSSTLTYWTESEAGVQGAFPGLLKELGDWRQRKINYSYDVVAGTLTKVALPDVPNTSGSRPTMQYTYTPAGSGYNDVLELRTNLESITDPQEVATGGAPRVRFTYGTGGSTRDHVVSQQWGTGETASFTYPAPTDVATNDALGQTRRYTLSVQSKDVFSGRAQVLTLAENGVTTSDTPFGQLPTNIAAAIPSTPSADRTTTISYDGEGLVSTASLNGVRSTTYSYQNVQPEAPGFVLKSMTTTAIGGSGAPITQSFTYQSGANRSTFLAAVSANGKTIDEPVPSRNNKVVQSNNDSITTTDTFDKSGLLKESDSSGGTDSSSAGDQVKIEYATENDPARHERSLPTVFDRGGVMAQVQYPSADRTIETDARGVVTTTDYDTWHRPVHIGVVGPQMSLDQLFEYDATGRLHKEVRKQGSADVTTSYSYDVMGRPTAVTVDNVANAGTVTTSTNYDLKNRTLTMSHPGGATTTVKMDGLGRATSRVTTTGGSAITDYFAYDLDDNLVFTSDLLTASATAYDAHGRAVGAMAADGSKTTADFDGWGRPTAMKNLDGAGSSVGESTLDYTDAGRLRSIASKVDPAQTRVTDFVWDGGGRATGVSTAGRAGHSQYDVAGRLLSKRAGGGTAAAVSVTFDESDVSSHVGTLPQKLQKKDKSTSVYDLAVEYNTSGQIVTRDLGDLEWKRDFDQAGNVTSSKMPSRPARIYEYDSRGSIKLETLPGGGTNKYDYQPTGALTNYTDPANEITQVATDLIGRVIQRTYKDGTLEKIDWEGRRVKAITDRQGRAQSFNYNGKGQIATIAGAGGLVLDTINYDDAGRIIRWANDDSVLEYSDFDFDGHPRRTKQSRYRNGALVDQYIQDHTWSVHGERNSFTMPTYAGFASNIPWTVSINLDHDAVGNVAKLQRTLIGMSGSSSLLDADYRNAGRPNRRTITAAAGTQIIRDYGYDSANGLFNAMSVTSNGVVVAGSNVVYDGLQKSKARLLGVSAGARADQWQYDGRSRLQSSALARDTGATPQAEQLTVADFRSSLTRPATMPVDPPSIVFTETPSGHKIATMQRGSVIEQFVFNGGERSEDGRFAYQYDGKGRLAVVTEKGSGGIAPLRRVKYFYNGNDRIIGRTAEYAPVPLGTSPGPNDWKVEDRPEVLAADALPAASTFVWDPIDDDLVAIFKEGASQNPSIDGNGGLVRQIIHGGLGYDDPVEVSTVDIASPSGIGHLYPIYDEAGAGSLQVILNERGEVVSRSAAGGPYGEDEAILLGAAIDKVAVTAKKAADGKIVEVDIALRVTESIAPATLAAGVRLATVDASGNVVRTSNKAPILIDEATPQWSLTEVEWNALVDASPVMVGGRNLTPAALSIAATSSLRASSWSASAPILPAPQWALATKPIYTSTSLPVESRESLTNLAQWVVSIAANEQKTNTLYEVPSLLALGSARIGSGGSGSAGDSRTLIVSSSFHAQPFQDAMTGKSYVRARWFDSQTGVWLTPDPSGYIDSSNLYAYAGGDPINKRDPSGAYEADVHRVLTQYLAQYAGFSGAEAMSVANADEEVDTNPATKPVDNGLAGNWGVVLHYHFAINPGERVVRRNNPIARRGVEMATDLRALGQGLHLLQDSYSHEDAYVGNVIDQYNKYGGSSLWAFSHVPKHAERGIFHPDKPAIRSRADNHFTDQTWTDSNKAMEMAKVSFEAMIDYRVRNRAISSFEGGKLKQRWAEIEPSVRAFATARTKAAKQRWRGMFAVGLTFTKADLKDMTIDEK